MTIKELRKLINNPELNEDADVVVWQNSEHNTEFFEVKSASYEGLEEQSEERFEINI